ncbi:MAG: DUF4870 domain-containing protein [Chthoniobacterales bacterium]|nr:DUF4870 domain-containing protein [Chthoniobacterales bacterium]
MRQRLRLARASQNFFESKLIVWLVKRGDSPEIDAHGKEALNFQSAHPQLRRRGLLPDPGRIRFPRRRLWVTASRRPLHPLISTEPRRAPVASGRRGRGIRGNARRDRRGWWCGGCGAGSHRSVPPRGR